MKKILVLILLTAISIFAQNYYNEYGGYEGSATTYGNTTTYTDSYGGYAGSATINSDGSVNYYNQYGGYEGSSY